MLHPFDKLTLNWKFLQWKKSKVTFSKRTRKSRFVAIVRSTNQPNHTFNTIRAINWATVKNPGSLLSIESCLVRRDPYVMVYEIILYISYITWVGCHPLQTLNNQGPFFHCSIDPSAPPVWPNSCSSSEPLGQGPPGAGWGRRFW